MQTRPSKMEPRMVRLFHQNRLLHPPTFSFRITSMAATTKVLSDSPPNGLIPELQFARCMSNRYKNESFPRCVSCTRRWAGDTCRFLGIRFFLKDQKGSIVGVSFVENQKPDAPCMNFPNQWNTRLEESHIRETKVPILLFNLFLSRY